MIPAFLLSLREGLEAALIIGIVLGALRQFGHSSLQGAIWGGVIAAVISSLLAGLALSALGASFEGRAEQIFEGVAMLLAAATLTWMIFWMSRQAKNLRRTLERSVQRSLHSGSRGALFALAFLSVAREGLELVLFLTAARLASGAGQVYLGAAGGLALAAGLGVLLFASSRRLSLHVFFRVTNLLLLLFAAGLVAHGIHEFNEAGLIPAVIDPVWNLNTLLDEKSTFGSLLAALFGYNGNPSLSEVLAYAAYFAVMAFGLRRDAPSSRPAPGQNPA